MIPVLAAAARNIRNAAGNRMGYILILIGALCLLYFAALAVKQVDFCIIWLPAGLMFLALGGYMIYCRKYPQGFRLPVWALVVLGLILAVLLALFVLVESRIFRQMLEKPEPNLEYIIVLGAQVKGEKPSRALRKRLEKACEYLEYNEETVAVLSGGQGDGEDISEAECMYRELSAAGIEDERILLEDESTTTRENLEFSGKMIDGHLQNTGHKGKEARIGILSNDFHVYRGLLLGRKMGYTQLYGIAAGSDWRLQAHYLVREFFALIKEKIMENI